MIWNVADRRKRPHRWKKVHAIVEAVEHDNLCQDADQAPEPDPKTYILFEERKNISVHDAVRWADAFECPVTLFLYDAGSMR